MSAYLTDVICSTIQTESRLNPHAINRDNYNGTVDYGLCQYNTGKDPKTGKPFWIGPGADFANPEEVLNNPKKNVDIMIRETKIYGYPKWWYGYTHGHYLKFMPRKVVT